MCLLAGHGSIIGALLCALDFVHPRHSTVPCIMRITLVFLLDVDHIDTYSRGAVVNIQCSRGSVLLAKILSERWGGVGGGAGRCFNFHFDRGGTPPPWSPSPLP